MLQYGGTFRIQILQLMGLYYLLSLEQNCIEEVSEARIVTPVVLQYLIAFRADLSIIYDYKIL